MKYRSKPVEIEARHWVQSIGGDEAQVIVAWVNANGGEARYEPRSGLHVADGESIALRTINGWAYAAPGHYVVMGDATWMEPYRSESRPAREYRDFYPCDPETFERRWEPA